MYRRALLIAAVCAAVAVSLFLLYLRRYEQEASGGERVRVLVALRPLEKGKAVTGDALGVREIPQAYVEDRSIREADEAKVLGLRVGGLVQAQQTLMWTDLSVASEDHRELSALVQPGRRAVTIHFRNDGTGGMVRPGDYVDVIGVTGASGSSADEAQSARVLLQRVLVLAVGSSMSADDDGASGERRAGELTLSVTLGDAQLLAIAAQRGGLSVALRGADDDRTTERVPDVTINAATSTPREQVSAPRGPLPTELPKLSARP